MRSHFLESLTKVAGLDRNVVLLTADLGFGVFEDFEDSFPGQFFNVGVAEQSMIGVGSGLALAGKRVIVYSIGNFPTLRCLEQIRNDACYHELNITIVASGGGFSYGQLGMSHHATEDLAIMRALPGVEVCVPCSKFEAGELTKHLLKHSGVGYLRLDKTDADEIDDVNSVEFGKMRLFRNGGDVTLIAAGGILKQVLIAAEALESHGVDARVLACHSIKPFDSTAVIDACMDTGGIITVEEHNILGGLASAVAESCLDNGIFPKKFLRLGLKDEYSSVVGDQDYLRSYYGLDAKSVVQKTLETLS